MLHAPFIFRAEKTPKRKDFTKNPMPESTFLGAFNPWNSLCSGCFSLWHVGKTQTQRILKRGEGGKKKSLCWISLGVFSALYFCSVLAELTSEGCGCLGLPGVFPDVAWTAIFPRKWKKRRQEPELPDLAWNSQTFFFQTSATTR